MQRGAVTEARRYAVPAEAADEVDRRTTSPPRAPAARASSPCSRTARPLVNTSSGRGVASRAQPARQVDACERAVAPVLAAPHVADHRAVVAAARQRQALGRGAGDVDVHAAGHQLVDEHRVVLRSVVDPQHRGGRRSRGGSGGPPATCLRRSSSCRRRSSDDLVLLLAELPERPRCPPSSMVASSRSLPDRSSRPAAGRTAPARGARPQARPAARWTRGAPASRHDVGPAGGEGGYPSPVRNCRCAVLDS